MGLSDNFIRLFEAKINTLLKTNNMEENAVDGSLKDEKAILAKDAATKEKSIFLQAKSLLQGAVNRGELTSDEAWSEFGIEIHRNATDMTARNVKKAPTRAGSSDNSENKTNPIVINANITLDLDVAVTINVKVRMDGTIDTDTIIASLKQYIDQSNSSQTTEITAFFKQIFDQFSSELDLDLGKIMEAINKAIGLINENKTELGNLKIQINNVYKGLMDVMKTNFSYIITALDRQGQDITSLNKLLNILLAKAEKLQTTTENNHTEEMESLSEIYNVVIAMSKDLTELTADQRKYFEQIINMLGKQDLNITEILNLVKLIKIQGETNGNNINKVFNLVQEGNKQILDYLATINTNFSKYGDDILALLYQILGKEIVIPTPGQPQEVDLTEVLKKLDTILARLAKIEETGNKTYNNSEIIKTTTQTILDGVTKYGDKFLEFVNKVDTQFESVNKQLQTFDGYLKKINATTEETNVIVKGLQKISNDIYTIVCNLGNSGGGGESVTIDPVDYDRITNIINNAVAGMVQEINNKIEIETNNIKNNSNVNTKTILDSIGKLQGTVNNINETVNTIKNEDNSFHIATAETLNLILNKPVPSAPEGKDYTDILNEILNKIKELDLKIHNLDIKVDGVSQNINNNYTAIMNALNQYLGKDVDLSAVMAKLKEILDAIHNHKVIIVIDNNTGAQVIPNDPDNNVEIIDQDGNPCPPETPHEGERDDLDDALGVKAAEWTAFLNGEWDGTTDAINKVSANSADNNKNATKTGMEIEGYGLCVQGNDGNWYTTVGVRVPANRVPRH